MCGQDLTVQGNIADDVHVIESSGAHTGIELLIREILLYAVNGDSGAASTSTSSGNRLSEQQQLPTVVMMEQWMHPHRYSKVYRPIVKGDKTDFRVPYRAVAKH